MAKETFVVFEGGGAKGISHIGTLTAIEDRNLKIIGTAGTSAGAIVASLVAAGYEADDLLSEKEPNTEFVSDDTNNVSLKTLFDSLGTSQNKVLDLLEPRHWRRIRRLRWLLNAGNEVTRTRIIKTAAVAFIFFILWPIFSMLELRSFVPWVPIKVAAFLAGLAWVLSIACHVLLAVFLAYFTYFFSGLGSLRLFTDALDELLAAQDIEPKGDRVTFGDMKRHGRILKIVAAEISTGKMRLFSTENLICQDIPVSEAVAASCAVPLVFRPIQIQGSYYSDGGMVSNLPAWSLDEHLILDEESWVITSESVPADRLPQSKSKKTQFRRKEPKGFKALTAITNTAIFGAADLSTRGIAHHVSIAVPTEIGLLDFDITAQDAYDWVLASSFFADGVLEARFEEIEFLKDVHNKALAAIRNIDGLGKTKLRSALVKPIDSTGDNVAGYHLWCCEGFDEHPDKHLMLGKAGTLIDACLNGEKYGAYADLGTPEGRLRFYSPDKTGRLKVITPTCRKWALALPLSGARLLRASVAITFDGDVALGSNFEKVHGELVKLSKTWQA
ncbi:MAG: patatin-like phospholipase family protein [Pseudomonadota bacterium]